MIEDEALEKKKMKMMEKKSNVDHQISEDLILEILLCLPPASILKFKRVCRNWYSLTSNPNFPHSHCLNFHRRRLRSSSSPSGFFVCPSTRLLHPCRFATSSKTPPGFRSSSSVMYIPLTDLIITTPILQITNNGSSNCKLNGGYPLKLIDSCNGLLLYSTCNRSHHYMDNDDDGYDYYICNPISTHYHYKLPTITTAIHEQHEKEWVHCLYHDPLLHIVYDPSSSSLTYKVVKRVLVRGNATARNFPRKLYYVTYVYSSETGSWKLLLSSAATACSSFHMFSNTKAVLLNGVLYWNNGQSDSVLCLDVSKERFSELPLPPRSAPDPDGGAHGGVTYRTCLYFGECGGRLRLIERYTSKYCHDSRTDCKFPCELDMMECSEEPLLNQQQQRRDSSWTIKYRIAIHNPNPRTRSFQIMDLHKKQNKVAGEEEVLMLHVDQTWVASYNVPNATLTNEVTYESGALDCDFRVVFPYTVTLLPL